MTKNDTTNDVAVVDGLATLPGVETEPMPVDAGEQPALIGFRATKIDNCGSSDYGDVWHRHRGRHAERPERAAA